MRLAEHLYRWPRLLLILSAIFWAGNVIAGRLAVDQISPITLVFVRWVMVLGVLWPLYGKEVRTHWSCVRHRLIRVVLMAVFGFTGFNTLFYYAAHYASAVDLGILQGALPIFVLAGAFLAHRTSPTKMQLLGVLITAVGVAVVATGGEPRAILELQFNRGALAMVTASMLYAFYTVALRDRPQMPSVPFFTLLAVIAAVTSVPLLVVEAFCAANSFTSAVTTPVNGVPAAPGTSGPTRSTTPACTPSSAAATWRQNRTGSLSPVSSDSHATGRSVGPRPGGQEARLAEPRGPQTNTSSSVPACNRRTSRGRGTQPARGCGVRNLVASSASWADATEADGACDGAIVGPPQPGGSTRPCACPLSAVPPTAR